MPRFATSHDRSTASESSGAASWGLHPGGGNGWPGARRFARRLVAVFALFFLLPIAIGIMIAAGFAGWTGAASVAIVISVLVVTAALIARSAFRSFRSVSHLVSSTGRLSEGDYSVRMAPSPSAAFRPATEAFNRMAERLERSDDLRRQLLADVGHELRTPLTIIRGELEAVADGVREADEREIRRLLGDVAAMERLLDDLKMLSTTEADVLELHCETTDVVELVHDVALRFRSEARDRNVELTVSPTRGTGSIVQAEIDPHRVGEVIANLVANALRAVPPGGTIALRVAEAELDDQSAAVIEVIDDGSGIPDDQLEAVFDRFHKGADSTGSGLGLTISRGLIHSHGGEIDVVSDLGVGTTITVTLPVTPGDRRDE